MPELHSYPPPPNVEILLLDPNEQNALFNTQETDDLSAVWSDYTVQNRYEDNRRIFMMANTIPGAYSPSELGGKVSFVQLAQPTLLWIADWTVARWKKRPKIPNPQVSDDRWVLLHKIIEPGTATLGPNGIDPLYRISGTYIYGHKDPSADPIDLMNFGRPAWLEESEPTPGVQLGIDRRVTDDMYEDSIIDGFGFPKAENAP